MCAQVPTCGIFRFSSRSGKRPQRPGADPRSCTQQCKSCDWRRRPFCANGSLRSTKTASFPAGSTRQSLTVHLLRCCIHVFRSLFGILMRKCYLARLAKASTQLAATKIVRKNNARLVLNYHWLHRYRACIGNLMRSLRWPSHFAKSQKRG